MSRQTGFTPPLQVMGYLATRKGDDDRGPEVYMNAREATLRLLVDGELVYVYGPRRHELAVLRVHDDVPRGGVVVRDVAGVAPSEIVRVRKVDDDRPPRPESLA